MKQSMRNLAALGLAAVTVLPVALRAEEMSDADMKVWRESVDERLKGLHNEVAEFNKVRFDAFTNLRYDDIRNPGARTGSSGIYVRRAEGKFSGLLAPHVTYSLGFDFPDAKLKDVGIEVASLPLIPFVDSGLEWNLRVGQYRIPFGIVPQTSSSAISFPERPMIFGGANQNGASKIVGERVMGLQGRNKMKLGFINTDLQVAMLNNATEDAARNNTGLAGQYTLQPADQDMSWAGRFAFEWAFLAGMLPEKSKLSTGASYIRDTQNTTWMAQANSAIKYDEVYGAEVALALGPQVLLQSEWVREMNDIVFGPTGVSSQREGWYGDLVVDLLPWIQSEIEKGDKLELVFRLEDYLTFNTAGADKGGHVKVSRIGGGLKWSYWGGKNHTSINYFVDGNNQDFGPTSTGGPKNMFVIQQQYAFENGKPKWMEKEAE